MVVVALVTLTLVVLTAFLVAPASATSSDFENYMWSYAGVGSNQVVCKKIVMHPEKQIQDRSSNRKVVKMYSTSMVVSDSYCTDLAKPVQDAS